MLKVDTHQHFWNLDEVAYPWLAPALGSIYRNFEAEELAPQLAAAGVDKTVIVQAMDSYADTDSMLRVAVENDWVAGVVGWAPLHDPDEAARKLDEYALNPYFKGIRHLIHDESNPDWLLQKQVIEGLQLLAERGLTFRCSGGVPRSPQARAGPCRTGARSQDGHQSPGQAAAWKFRAPIMARTNDSRCRKS